jgi:Xaa-Pro aminopeptidase
LLIAGVDMKSDLKDLMKRENLAALWVMGGASGNPDMHYFTGHAHIGFADLILPAGKEPVIFCDAIEREEAASTGLETVNVSKYDFPKLLEKTGGDVLQAQALEHQLMFQELGVTAGRVAVSGKTDLGPVIGMLKRLEGLFPDVKFIGEGNRCVLLEARATKDDNEIAHIRESAYDRCGEKQDQPLVGRIRPGQSRRLHLRPWQGCRDTP